MGRGLRSSPGTGKKDCLLLDFSGNIVRMAEDYSDIFYNGGTRSTPARSSTRRFVATTKRSRKESLPSLRIPADGQAMRFLRARGHQTISRRARARRDAGNPDQQDEICRRQAPPGSRHARMHAGIRRPTNSKGRAKHIFRDISGEWPDSSWNIATTPSVPDHSRGAQQDQVAQHRIREIYRERAA